MNQQINLLPPVPKEPKDWLKFNSLLPIFIMVVVLAVMATLWFWFSVSRSESDLANIQQDIQEKTANVEQLNLALHQKKPSVALQKRIALLKKNLAAKQRLASVLDGINPELQQSFSTGMYALSNEILSNLWLTSFSMGRALTSVQLEGFSKDAADIPVYLNSLTASEALNTLFFVQLETERADKYFAFKVVGNKDAKVENTNE